MTTDNSTTRFLAKAPHGFSNVVEVTGGSLVFITGQMALDDTGTLVGPGDYNAQLVQVFENLKTQLALVGADFTQVVKITVLAADSFYDHAQEFGEVRDRYVNLENPPGQRHHPGAAPDSPRRTDRHRRHRAPAQLTSAESVQPFPRVGRTVRCSSDGLWCSARDTERDDVTMARVARTSGQYRRGNSATCSRRSDATHPALNDGCHAPGRRSRTAA